ncbi:MAG: site-2 protease family protein [Oscillospiraceae bacterium]|nr:site-2 protease family protein [Oscillospiraceae bacterium]
MAIHEFGHFITAKMSGVRVNEFAIGMGPAILKKQFGETVYSLRLLPFGGFCAMEGEDSASDDPRAFGTKNVWKRILIVVAGSVMNLIAGFVVLALVFAPIESWYTTTVSSVGDNPALLEENSLLPGDTVRAIDGYRVHLYSDIFVGISRGGENGIYDIEVLRNGEKLMLEDVRLYNGTSEEGQGSGNIIKFEIEDSSFFGKLEYTALNAVNIVRLVKVGLVDLISGSVSKDDISGPVGIGKMMADTAKTSMSSLWYLLAFLSINLGVMNLLPFPALDGGRLVFLVFELIFRKPVPPKYEGFIHAAGLILLMLVMVFVTYNDIVKIFIK